MSAFYEFSARGSTQELSLYYEDEAVAIDMTRRHIDWRDNESLEVIMPVSEVENLITNLQTMVAKIREHFPDAA